ncbi:hypothetical protein FB451DRAFT_1401625 [Mycena latifolia]|nr:hypothetical protein FB451DRAFT_1401625 [Mycena latifolia]
MHATPTTITTVQHVAEASVAVANTHESTVVTPVNRSTNGPQCAHCGWRGGSHASNCPFRSHILAAVTSFAPQCTSGLIPTYH